MAEEDTKQLSRKDREREQHRREILEAAEQVFVAKGYDAATIEEIAKKAEFSVGTLYNFFKGKDELYTCVLQAHVQDFVRQFEEKVLSLDDPEQAIAALIELRLTHFEKHRGFVRVLFGMYPGSEMDPSRLLPPQCAEQRDRCLQAVIRIFERGISQRIFDGADPLYFTLSLEGVLNAFIAYWSRCEPAESLPVRIGKVQREFLGRIKQRVEGAPQRRT